MRILKFNKLLLLSTLISLFTINQSYAVTASYSDSNFEEIFKVTDLQSIEMWKQPKTQYTPKNLVSEQQMRFSGKNGSNRYESYTFHVTDYDTKITGTARGSDGSYYIQDNTGKYYKTGEQGLSAKERETIGEIPSMKTEIKSNTSSINKTQAQVNSVQSQVNNMQGQINGLGSKINNVERRMEQGLATVTALTALHPNPRHQGKTQVSVGTGMYSDNVAGAIGIFHYLNDRVMLNAGAAYGGNTSWAGNVGITIGL